MWIVFNSEDFWEQGYSVENESEALEICNSNPLMDYIYVGIDTLAYVFQKGNKKWKDLEKQTDCVLQP